MKIKVILASGNAKTMSIRRLCFHCPEWPRCDEEACTQACKLPDKVELKPVWSFVERVNDVKSGLFHFDTPFQQLKELSLRWLGIFGCVARIDRGDDSCTIWMSLHGLLHQDLQEATDSHVGGVTVTNQDVGDTDRALCVRRASLKLVDDDGSMRLSESKALETRYKRTLGHSSQHPL